MGPIAYIQGCNLNDIPPGNYDLGGFVFDASSASSIPPPSSPSRSTA